MIAKTEKECALLALERLRLAAHLIGEARGAVVPMTREIRDALIVATRAVGACEDLIERGLEA